MHCGSRSWHFSSILKRSAFYPNRTFSPAVFVALLVHRQDEGFDWLPSQTVTVHVSALRTCCRWAAAHLQPEAVGSVRGSAGEVRVAAGSGGSVQWLPVDHVGAAAGSQSDSSSVSAACMAAHVDTHTHSHTLMHHGWGVLEVSHSMFSLCRRKCSVCLSDICLPACLSLSLSDWLIDWLSRLSIQAEHTSVFEDRGVFTVCLHSAFVTFRSRLMVCWCWWTSGVHVWPPVVIQSHVQSPNEMFYEITAGFYIPPVSLCRKLTGIISERNDTCAFQCNRCSSYFLMVTNLKPHGVSVGCRISVHGFIYNVARQRPTPAGAWTQTSARMCFLHTFCMFVHLWVDLKI